MGQSRRQFLRGCLVLVGLGPALVTGCGLVPAVARRPGLPRIGYLGGSVGNSSIREFLAGMRDLGYVEGQTVQIDWRFDEGRPERLAELAAELVQLEPDVIVAGASTPPAVAAKYKSSEVAHWLTKHPSAAVWSRDLRGGGRDVRTAQWSGGGVER